MELRRVEAELKSHCISWQELRRVRVRGLVCDGDTKTSVLPTLKELFFTLHDKDIFLPPPPPEPTDESEVKEDDENLKEDKKSDKETSTYDDEKSESVSTTKPVLSASDDISIYAGVYLEEEDGDTIGVEMTPQQIIEVLENLKSRLKILSPKMKRFRLRLNEKDPVSGKSRYGEKTMARVKQAIRAYTALDLGLVGIFQDDASFVSNLRSQVRLQEELLKEELSAKRTQEQIELERIAKEKLLAEKYEKEQRQLEEKRKREEELLLSRRAEEARRRRVEEEQLAIAAEREADVNLISSVSTKGPEGVREQIQRMRQALAEDDVAFHVALGSLYTLFDQITRKPEEVNFRRIRRDHPKFNDDIGRHTGGKEVLIAAGFRLETLDGVKCFFSREPNLENDMDMTGWSNWFDGLKKSLAVIEEEMIK